MSSSKKRLESMSVLTASHLDIGWLVGEGGALTTQLNTHLSPDMEELKEQTGQSQILCNKVSRQGRKESREPQHGCFSTFPQDSFLWPTLPRNTQERDF